MIAIVCEIDIVYFPMVGVDAIEEGEVCCVQQIDVVVLPGYSD